MSAQSKTPDDKMHRYLQRIQKLVGHRAKSPIMIKSRNKSPMNVKASRISVQSKYEPFVRTLIFVCNKKYKDTLTQFFYKLFDMYQIRSNKRRDSHFSQQTYKNKVKKQNDQPLAIRFMVKTLHRSIIDILKQLFDSLRRYQASDFGNQQQQLTKDINISLKHRRTYSEIYAQSLTKYQSKSPATSQRYEYKTPSVAKKGHVVQLKKLQARIIFTVLQKIYQKSRQNFFSEIKNFYCSSLSFDINEAKNFVSKIQEKFTSLKNQQQKTVEQLKKANQTIVDHQKAQQSNFLNLERIKEQSLSKNQDDQDFRVDNSNSQTQKIFHQMKGVLLLDTIFQRKNVSLFASGFKIIKNSKSNEEINSAYLKCLALSNTLKSIWNGRKRFFLTSLIQYAQIFKSRQKSQKSLFKTQSRELITQRSNQAINLHQPQPGTRMHSMQSSKHSRSSQKSNTSNFDIIAKKINSAFQFQATLRQIYSYSFQKIDQAAFIYMTISTPISKMVKVISRESFRKILFYSFFKSQEDNKLITEIKPKAQIRPLNDKNKLMTENKPPFNQKLSNIKISSNMLQQAKIITKNYEKMSAILKKVEKKMIFMKIEAYSFLKLNSDLKQPIKISQDVVISQVDLKKQIKDFLNQRNKMHQKTYDTWSKTKQMLQDPTNATSRLINARIKT